VIQLLCPGDTDANTDTDTDTNTDASTGTNIDTDGDYWAQRHPRFGAHLSRGKTQERMPLCEVAGRIAREMGGGGRERRGDGDGGDEGGGDDVVLVTSLPESRLREVGLEYRNGILGGRIEEAEDAEEAEEAAEETGAKGKGVGKGKRGTTRRKKNSTGKNKAPASSHSSLSRASSRSIVVLVTPFALGEREECRGALGAWWMSSLMSYISSAAQCRPPAIPPQFGELMVRLKYACYM
jgi:hypothetical protein